MASKSINISISVSVAKAAPIADQQVPSVTISISEPVPNFPSLRNLPAAADWYEAQAQKLEIVLYNSLPGGTYDHLLAVMLRRKASHFRVAHGSSDEQH